MSADRPDLSRRRTIVVPAPDEGIDPIDLQRPTNEPQAVVAQTMPATPPTPKAVQRQGRSSPKVASKLVERTRDLNCEVTETVMETIDFAKFKTKLSKREIVQQAILNHWSEYVPNTGVE